MSTNANPILSHYRVTLLEEPGDKFQMIFDCMAEDADHAAEQAEAAYPGCEVINCSEFDENEGAARYVVYSPNESAAADGAGFWNNEEGWTEFEHATVFLNAEALTLQLPVSAGNDARYVNYHVARKHYGTMETSPEKEAFKRKVGTSVNCMLQDDARGETMVFVRKDGNLIPKSISADTLDMENLEQFEMILFDGGNSAGDSWKHVFFPQRLESHFVDENPLPRETSDSLSMLVSVDGGVSFRPAPEGVRIIYQNIPIDDEGSRGEVHVNATHEGLITDIWTTQDEPLDQNIGTDCVAIEDIVSRLVDDNA